MLNRRHESIHHCARRRRLCRHPFSVEPDVVDRLRTKEQMISVYETTGDYDIIAIGKFEDTDRMNAQIKDLLSDVDIRESNTSVVLNAVKEHTQFDLNVDDE